jgi:glutamate 5-kinase
VDRRELFQNIKRVVVKIGSSSLSEGSHLSYEKMKVFVSDVCTLMRKGCQVTVVTSGAISAGADRMNRRRETLTIPEKQALAAVGQTILVDKYRELFFSEGFEIGQVLLAGEDVTNRARFINARNAMLALLDMGVVPIVNENDTVAVNEIKLGDNDTLSAYVSQIIGSDLVILLSDIDGFYRNLSDPAPLSEICEIDDGIWASAGGSGSKLGTGGMFTKIRAADMVTKTGSYMIIAEAGASSILDRIVSGENIGTLFHICGKTLDGKKRWIAFNMDVCGTLTIDSGAVNALVDGKKSLLAAGITKYSGIFSQGDAVDIVSLDGKLIARGITNYDAADVEKIKGLKTSQIEKMLGELDYDEVVHRDNMIVY